MTTLLDTTIRRDAQLLRFGTYLKSEYIAPAFLRLSKDIPPLLANYEELTKAEQNALARQVRVLMSERMSSMFDSITKELGELTDDEAAFMLDLYDDYTTETLRQLAVGATIPTANNALISLDANGNKSVGVWAEHIKKNINSSTALVDGVIRSGMRDGEALSSMTQKIRGTYNRGSKAYSGGILNGLATTRAETLARTGISHYSNQARDKFAKANDDILTFKVFFATLDISTTDICAGFHAKKYLINDASAPVFPLHYNERSVYVYGGDGIDPLEGSRPLVGGKKGKAAKEEFERRKARQNSLRDSRAEKRAAGESTPTTASKVKYKGRKDSGIFDVEVVSAKVSAQSFYERQPRWWLEERMGKEKAKLFLDGGLKIDKFTDLRGRPLNLKQLRETAAGERAFRRMGV